MTAARGMLWKTAWSRRHGGLVNQPAKGMWFFNLQELDVDYWSYNSLVAAPSFAANPSPVWIGMVCYASGPSGVGLVEAGNGVFQGLAFGGSNFVDTDGKDDVGFNFDAAAAIVNVDANGAGIFNFNWQTVDVVLATVVPELGGSRIEVWLDNQRVASVFTANPYVPQNTITRLRGLSTQPTLNGVVGGTGVLTTAQIRQWFMDVRDAADIQPIPGMTTDLWSASSVQPLVPLVLPNLAGGQALNLTANGAPVAPTNTLVPVSFNY